MPVIVSRGVAVSECDSFKGVTVTDCDSFKGVTVSFKAWLLVNVTV